ncbi:DUF1002 domain-containing protein [Thermoanaerobacterium sp. CMT5567-10]|uniref:DUF1002 domain-containing protein n=1 Tax=Thermoanaerobacterium sp. CMT5567-10 TaxID=3061989 RepID=UPI0026DF113A|nr:DUF1002 domain-containing protein [Thermoanaerobacterium sp. CMT5567-10]WKV09329.1 DUF1002 domain-containing protein [Thermoanaerobacterium sp. CMT5567-10]
MPKFMKHLKITVTILLVFTTFFTVALADTSPGTRYLTFGHDLTNDQRNQILKDFNLNDTNGLHIIEVTNQEEYKYLGGSLPANVIGSKAISSSLITFKEKGSGLNVTTHNITWVTSDMYKNALITAGVEDADIKVSAPYPVSGTAALTGIIKAYEEATGKPISDDVKKIANEEMVTTGQIGDKIGDKEKAVELLKRLKEEMSKQTGKLSDAELRSLIQNTANSLGITLTQDEINSLVSLLRKLQNANINWDKVKSGLDNLTTSFKDFVNKNPESKSVIKVILQFFQNIINKLLSLL